MAKKRALASARTHGEEANFSLWQNSWRRSKLEPRTEPLAKKRTLAPAKTLGGEESSSPLAEKWALAHCPTHARKGALALGLRSQTHDRRSNPRSTVLGLAWRALPQPLQVSETRSPTPRFTLAYLTHTMALKHSKDPARNFLDYNFQLAKDLSPYV